MAKSTLTILALTAILIISVVYNIYQWNTNQTITQQNSDLVARQQMRDQLAQTQTNVNTQLTKLDNSIQTTCQKLSITGLDSPTSRSLLSELVAINSLIVNAATSDSNDIIVAVEPTNYSSIEGENISNQEQNIQMHQTMQPAMSDMIPLVEGFPGVVMVAPIFDANDKFMGSLSIVIQPSLLINSSIVPPKEGVEPYPMWAMQTNGTLIYDPDPAQQGKNLFTDPLYTSYTGVQTFTQQVSANQSGYGTYQYYNTNLDNASKQLVNKEAYWTTIGIYGTQWRLVVTHITFYLNSTQKENRLKWLMWSLLLPAP
jgi:sensor domain CHASE-containing protein